MASLPAAVAQDNADSACRNPRTPRAPGTDYNSQQAEPKCRARPAHRRDRGATRKLSSAMIDDAVIVRNCRRGTRRLPVIVEAVDSVAVGATLKRVLDDSGARSIFGEFHRGGKRLQTRQVRTSVTSTFSAWTYAPLPQPAGRSTTPTPTPFGREHRPRSSQRHPAAENHAVLQRLDIRRPEAALHDLPLDVEYANQGLPAQVVLGGNHDLCTFDESTEPSA